MMAGKGDLDQTGGTAMKLRKSPGTMTSKERVLRTFHHEKADRVPISYFANPGIQKRVAAYLGVPQDRDSVNDALGVDFKGLMPAYTGKPLFTAPGSERHVNPLTGAVTRWVENQNGGYWDYCDFPLADADDEVIANWPVPDPDDFDYDGLLEQCRAYGNKAVYLGHPGISDVMNNTGMIRGMENDQEFGIKPDRNIFSLFHNIYLFIHGSHSGIDLELHAAVSNIYYYRFFVALSDEKSGSVDTVQKFLFINTELCIIITGQHLVNTEIFSLDQT